jgi:hypothetical protein
LPVIVDRSTPASGASHHSLLADQNEAAGAADAFGVLGIADQR